MPVPGAPYRARCIHCGTLSRRSERAAVDGRCPACRHHFAFEPARDPHGVDDEQVRAAIERVSDRGTMSFTERQLWYEFNRRWIKPPFWHGPRRWDPAWGAGLSTAAAWYWAWPLLPLAAAGSLLGAACAVLLHREDGWNWVARPPRVPLEAFRRDYLPRWTDVHGPVAGLLPPRGEAAPPARPREVPADVAGFSFDRAVVAEHRDVAEMLVANRFHFEHNCAILSLDGYPEGIAGTVREMLRRNPRLTVFALHDATPEGCALPFTLTGEEWFPGPEVRVVDVGLWRLVDKSRQPTLPAGPPRALPPGVRKLLFTPDAEWLQQGNRGELAVLGPGAIVSMLYDAIRRAGEPGDQKRYHLGKGPAAGVIAVTSFLPAGRDHTEPDSFG